MESMRDVMAQVNARQRPFCEIGCVHHLRRSQYEVRTHAKTLLHVRVMPTRHDTSRAASCCCLIPNILR